MAAREGQGLQIAVIIFAMLTIILAITTFIFYSQAQTAMKERETAVKAQGEAQNQNNKLMYRLRAYQLVMGAEGTTQEIVDQAKATAGGDDAEATATLDNFKKDIATYAAEAGAAANYRTLPSYFLAALAKKNTSVVDANDLTRQAQAAKDAEQKAKEDLTVATTAAITTARSDLATEQTKFADERTRITNEKDTLAKQIAANTARSKAELDKVAKDRDVYIAQTTNLQSTITTQKERLEELQRGQADLFENPDGKITWVNQKQQLVWLNVGRSDGLLRQTTFAVYDHDENGVANAEAKARLEVVRIVGDHLAEARILEDKASNPILPGDLIHTPSWSPGQRIHFALAGKIDINKDGTSDFDLVKNIILINGGVIDAEVRDDGSPSGKLTIGTRYLILGEAPDERSSQKALEEFSAIRTKAREAGTATIDVPKFLEMMGWRAEERTVELAGSTGTGEFRKRTVGKKAAPPAAGAAPAEGAEPAEGAPATPAPMPAGADPFGPGAADPFATPAAPKPATPAAPAPMPPAEADPFGTP
jgi:hypothetical protein